MSSASIDLSGSVYCVVSGASQGIGRSVAVEFAKNIGPGSVMLLMARNQEGLIETAELCKKYDVKVNIKSIDLASASAKEMFQALKESLEGFTVENFDRAIIVHNVGSIGNISEHSTNFESNKQMADYFNLNVFNVVTLNSQFMKIFSECHENVIIVNITSICAIKPMAGLAYYCSGKAAREMYFRVIAEEFPNIRVLNYSPGPVETSMIDYIVDNAVNDRCKEVFISFKQQKILLKPEVTAEKCLQVLKDNKFTNGQHVDYFD